MAFHSIIPAGGIGSRLWPLSRAAHPKFLSDFTGSGASMLQETATRLRPLSDSLTIVTSQQYASEVAQQVSDASILTEPSPRGTMPAIALATAIIMHSDPGAVVGSFAADHYIHDEQAFHSAVARAIEAANDGYIATLGITPDSPSTAYGYIRRGADTVAEGAYRAEAFVEKPDEQTAQNYLGAGTYVWNAGIFIAKARVLWEQLEALRPDISQPISEIAGAWGSADYEETLGTLWPTIPDTVIDRIIAEPCASEGRVAVVPVDMGWSDIGDFDSLAEIMSKSESAPHSPTLEIDCARSFICGIDKPVVVLGIEGAVVVETPEALLVTRRESAQNVKKIVDSLPEKGLENLL